MKQATCVLTHRKDPDRVRNAADGLLICHGCYGRLERRITGFPALDADLLLAHLRPGHAGEKTSGSHAVRLPIVAEVAAMRARLEGACASWARVVIEDQNFTFPADYRLSTTCDILERNLKWLAKQPLIGECAAELDEIGSRAFSLAYPSGRRVFTVRLPDGSDAPCIEGECKGVLQAVIRDQEDLLPSCLVCSADDAHEVPSTAWVKLGRKLRQEAS